MSKLFYFTGGGKASNHYVDTILGSVKLGNFEDLLTPGQRDAIEKIYSNQDIKVWGAVPGENNTRNYENMGIGDAVLIYKDKYFSHAGYVSYKLISRNIADRFWGRDENDQTWELIYFLKDLSEVDIPVEKFNEETGYKSSWKPQGFSKLSDDRLKRIIRKYGSVGEFINSLSGLDFSIDAIVEEAESYHRGEEEPNEEEELEAEAEIKAERFYRGLSEEQRKKRARKILQRLKDEADKQGAKSKPIYMKRYERGPAGQAVKEIYDYKCMVEGCGFTFLKKNGERYAEAHHLESLSDGGPDDPSNIVILCPNHHAQFHYANVEKVSRNDEELIVRINGDEITLKFKHQGEI